MAKKDISKNGGILSLKMIIIVLFIVVLAAAALFANQYLSYKKMKSIVEVDTFYDDVTVNFQIITGLTKEEALDYLDKSIQQPLNKEELILDFNGEEIVYTFDRFGAKYDFEAAVEEAYGHGRTGTLKERYEVVSNLMFSPFNVNAEYLCDEEMIKEEVRKLAEEKNVAPQNATMRRENGQFIITNEIDGLKINEEALVRVIKETVMLKENSKIVVTVEPVKAQYSAEFFRNSQELIGSFSTGYTQGDSGRITNMRVAAGKLNDSIVYPGEIFSTNITFGPTTAANGYKPAPTIVGGKLVDDYGGGVCQISSTLYNAILYSELEIVERQNHSMKVGYADYGFDATLAGDYIDLKFKNTTDYAVYIESYLTGSKAIVNMYGHEIHPPDRHLKFEKALIETVPAPAESITYSDELADGTRKITTNPSDGYKYKVYKLIYEGNSLSERIQVNTSTYKPRRGEVIIGTGDPAEIDDGLEQATGVPDTDEIESIPTIEQLTEPVSQPVNGSPEENTSVQGNDQPMPTEPVMPE